MAHEYVEIHKDSRGLEVSRTSINQTIVLTACIDDSIEAVLPGTEIHGMDDDTAVLEYAYQIVPETRVMPDYNGDLQLLVLDRIRLEQTSPSNWRFTCEYLYDVNTGSGGQQSMNNEALPYVKLGFKIGGGTKTIKKALEVVSVDRRNLGAAAPPDAAVLTDADLIGATADSIQGISVPDSAFSLQITAYYLPSFFNQAFQNEIIDLIDGPEGTGTYNGTPFLGRPPGEVQLRSASGGANVVDIIPITFDFYIKRNQTNRIDPGFPPLTMRGHDNLDYRFVPSLDDGTKRIIMSPRFRVTQRVFSPVNYGGLRLP